MKHLLPRVPKYFRANLHTHSTISDGKFSPKELKEIYKEHGYQILAITDHNIISDQSALTDEEFLMLTGVEISVAEVGKDVQHKKSYHLNLISRHPHNLWIPYLPKKPKDSYFPYINLIETPEMERHHNTESVNKIIAAAKEHDFLVTYNHPVWSLHNYTDYAELKGLWAMEVCNYNALYVGHDGYSPMVYRDLLAKGNRLFPVGSDDMHKMYACGGAWIMVGAEKLDYETVIQTLENGDFYASTGPEIYSLTLDGSELKITCSDARSIALETDCRVAKHEHAESSDKLLQEATFDLTKWIDASRTADCTEKAYIRLTVYGPDGTRAYTRAYYFTELL